MTRPGRILVTGAAGFVGSVLVERLLAEGRVVVGFDSFDPFYPEEQKRRNLRRALDHADFRLERGDIRDAEAVERVFAGEAFDGVVHLAALAGVRPSLERPAAYADVNVRGTATSVVLGEAARASRPARASCSPPPPPSTASASDGPFRGERPRRASRSRPTRRPSGRASSWPTRSTTRRACR